MANTNYLSIQEISKKYKIHETTVRRKLRGYQHFEQINKKKYFDITKVYHLFDDKLSIKKKLEMKRNRNIKKKMFFLYKRELIDKLENIIFFNNSFEIINEQIKSTNWNDIIKNNKQNRNLPELRLLYMKYLLHSKNSSVKDHINKVIINEKIHYKCFLKVEKDEKINFSKLNFENILVIVDKAISIILDRFSDKLVNVAIFSEEELNRIDNDFALYLKKNI